MIIFLVIEWMAGITENYIGLLFVNKILGYKTGRYKLVLLLSVILTSGLLIINSFSLFSWAATVYGIAAMTICAYFLYKKNPVDIIVAVASYLLLLHFLDFFLITLVELFAGENGLGNKITEQLSMYRSVLVLASKGLLILIYIYLSRILGRFSILSKKILVGVLVALCLIYNLEKLVYREMRLELLGIGFLLLLVAVMGEYLIIQYAEARETNMQMELLNERNKIMAEGYEDMLETYKKNAVYFHDLKHRIIKIKQCLLNHKSEEALDYIIKLDSGNEEIGSKGWTGSAIIDFILNYKKAIAEKQGISFDINADIISLGEIDESDICVLLGNVLDNAIEHCEKEDAKPEVRIAIRKIHEMMILKVTNTCKQPPQKKDGRYTSKRDKNVHGWGLKSIEMTVEKYGGILQCDYENGKYTVTVTFFN